MNRTYALGVALGIVSSQLVAGCQPGLPPCDPAAAREVVYLDAPSDLTGDDGVPMYLGQALAYGGCGANAFCHSERADAEFRVGAPHGLDFDVAPTCSGYVCAPFDEDLLRSSAGRARLLRHAEAAYGTVVRGAMPPGRVGAVVAGRAGVFRRAPADPTDLSTGAVVPDLGSADGQRAFGVWLACGAPLVTTTFEPDAARPAGSPCDGDLDGSCVTRARFAVPDFDTCASTGAPTFDALFDRVFAPLCADACHGDETPRTRSLTFADREATYATLMIPDPLAPNVVPGNPGASHIVHHLEGLFGTELMPRGLLSSRLDPVALAAVRAWIEAGATRACPP